MTKHDVAIDLTEQALEKLADGDEDGADKLLAQAKKLDPTGPAEVLEDIDEDLVQRRAYELWEQAGRPEGLDQEHWAQARHEIEHG
jgi:uncharacterized protein HemY